MEKNTVLLNLVDYNKLRDFETEIKKGNTFCIWDGWGQNLQYISTNKAIEAIVGINKELKAEIDKLKSKGKPKAKTLNDVKKMSIWQFIKWRRR